MSRPPLVLVAYGTRRRGKILLVFPQHAGAGISSTLARLCQTVSAPLSKDIVNLF